MKKSLVIAFAYMLCIATLFSQNKNTVSGKIIDASTSKPLKGVLLKIVDSDFFTETNFEGEFKFTVVTLGNWTVQIELSGYQSQTLNLSISENRTYNLGTIYLQKSVLEIQNDNFITLSDDDFLDNEERSSDYIAGLFQSSKDAFLKAAAFNFSQAWFKVRGYDSSYGTILINGVEMNKLYDGRPQWSNWGGLNDVFRNQEFSNGISPSEQSFGNILGTTNFNTRASEYNSGGKFSMASTNRSYTGRIMATYATGLTKNNWAFAASGSRRIANEGYTNGTTYNAWAAFFAAEKKLNSNNSINLTALISSNRRGKSSPNTQEVFNLKGLQYNAYWGKQEGDKRNSRIKEIAEPIVMLSHFYNSEKTSITTTLAFQFGHISNSRLGYFNAQNPDPTYWKYLPSSYLQYEDNLDYAGAYLAEQEFINNGQINWEKLYQTNADNGSSLYYLYEDRINDLQITLNSILNTNLSDKSNLNLGISYKNLTSNNYANMIDLLGGTGFLDLDQYAEGDAQQNDLNNPNKIIYEDDKFQYNYTINATNINAFAQLQITQKKVDYFVATTVKHTQYQREGLFKNGTYANNSFGKGEKQSFTNINVKGGLTYKFTGRHLLNLNAGYFSNAPTIKNTFSNSRVNNTITPNLTSEKILTADINYIFRLPKVLGRITAFYTKFTSAVETSFFFAEGLLGDQADFVNEITTGIEKQNIGAEFSIEYQIIPSVKLIGAGSFGRFSYNNNPQLYLQSESFTSENSNFGVAYLKNYKISGTPQRAYAVGFEYRDPNFWWFQANANLLTHNYLDISPLLRTDNFYTDADGVPFVDDQTGEQVTQNQIAALLEQEKFNDAFLVNVVGGKSWKINNNYIGFFAGINNVLGEVFKSGGFEQSRKANYLELKQDKLLEKPIFGPKYWYGNKASYYLNVYIRF